MKKRLYFITSLIVCLLDANAHAQLRKASDYFPLQIGNIWEYQHYLGFSKPQHFEITSDTLIADTVRVYRTLLRIMDVGNPSPQEGYVYYHYNSDSTAVYRDYEFPVMPYYGLPMIDTRHGILGLWHYPIGDYRGDFAITDTGSIVLFDSLRHWAQVKGGIFYADSTWDTDYSWSFVESIGPVRAGLDTLLYAKINGINFGRPISAVETRDNAEMPMEFSLHVYPNPVYDKTTIEITVASSQQLEVCVMNLLGQKVYSLHSGNVSPGRQQLFWNGQDDHLKKLPVGIYFVVLQSQEIIRISKVLYIK